MTRHTPEFINALHRLHRPGISTPEDPDDAPPPRYERVSARICQFAAGFAIIWFGGHLLIGILS